MNVGAALAASPEAAELTHQAQAALHDPTGGAKAAAMLGIATGQQRGDPAAPRLALMGLGIVGPVALDPLRPAPPALRRRQVRLDMVPQRLVQDRLGHRRTSLCADPSYRGTGRPTCFPLGAMSVGGVGPGIGERITGPIYRRRLGMPFATRKVGLGQAWGQR